MEYNCFGLPRWLSHKEFTCQGRRCKRRVFDPWVRGICWRRKWQPAPVFLPGKFHGQSSLVGYSLWDCNQVDMTEWLSTHIHTHTHTHTHTHSCFTMSCYFLLHRDVNQPYVYLYAFFFSFSSHLGQHRVLRVELPVLANRFSFFFKKWKCFYRCSHPSPYR